MPLNNSVASVFALLAAGCGAGGYCSAPLELVAKSGSGHMVGQVDPARTGVPASAQGQEAPPPDLPQGAGPRGTSNQERYDTVGYAGLYPGGGTAPFAAATNTVAHPSLPVGTFVEVTALDTGRTIVALVADRGTSGRIVELSPGAAQSLGVGDGAAVRVRIVTASLQDQAALQAGRAAASRIDAPEALLKALRKRLPARSVAARPVKPASPPSIQLGAPYAPPAETPERPAVAARREAFVVQVAAFSTRERAQTVARQLGGKISAGGGFFRVQIGPFADSAGARQARDAVARQGYGDARILHIE